MKRVAIIYTCSNPGQTALLWAWQPAPFGHGWIDVKAEPLVRLSDTFSTEEINIFRQWFNCIEDVAGDYIEQVDRDLHTKLMGMLK